ncbi:MAG: thiamine phosphate synthase [Gemmatimonadaceae bacterium]
MTTPHLDRASPLVFDPTTLTLLAITDDLRDGRDGLVARAAAAVRGGATMVQARLKDVDARLYVEVVRSLVAALAVPVIVNDRADIAIAAGAAGVHVGADDVPASALRRLAPRGFIIGASVGCDAETDGAAGADYVGIGPLFETVSKGDAGAAIGIDAFARLAARCALPAVAIGGVTEREAPAVMAAGAAGIAVIRAVFGSLDPEQAARAMRSAIGR